MRIITPLISWFPFAATGRNLGAEGAQRKSAGEPRRVPDEVDSGAAEAARVAERGARDEVRRRDQGQPGAAGGREGAQGPDCDQRLQGRGPEDGEED